MTARSALIGAMLVAFPLLASAQQSVPPAAAPAAKPAPPAPPSAADSAAVRQVVSNVFDGMRSRDTAKLRAQFAPGARLMTVGTTRDGSTRVQADSVASFVTSIAGAPADKVLDERLFNTELRMDGPLATVWTEYDFYVNKDFSHCGVDAFQLAKLADGWKIVQLADTRKRVGCARAPK
jgi:hypothetical protein